MFGFLAEELEKAIGTKTIGPLFKITLAYI